MHAIYAEIDEIAAGLESTARKAGASTPIARQPIDLALAEVEESARKHAGLLQPWLAMSELAAETLLHLHNYALAVRASAEAAPSFALLTGRACSLTLCIRRLVLSGQDEGANVLVRSLLENLDIALAVLDDSDFADRYVIADSTEAKKFWGSEIARSKVQEKADETLRKSGLPEPKLVERRKADWLTFSGSTHSSFMSAFRSAAIVSLIDGHPVPSPVGHLGIFGPVILNRVTNDSIEFLGAVVRLSMLPQPPKGFQRELGANRLLLDTFAASFFTLQEIVKRHRLDINAHIGKWVPPPAV